MANPIYHRYDFYPVYLSDDEKPMLIVYDTADRQMILDDEGSPLCFSDSVTFYRWLAIKSLDANEPFDRVVIEAISAKKWDVNCPNEATATIGFIDNDGICCEEEFELYAENKIEELRERWYAWDSRHDGSPYLISYVSLTNGVALPF